MVLQRRDAAVVLDMFFDELPVSRNALAVWALMHPAQTLLAWRAMARLPVLDAAPSRTHEGKALAAGLARQSAIGRLVTFGATAVLDVPVEPGAYLAGGRRTLRKRHNSALKAGVRWERVEDRAARERLLERANQRERTHPDARYRTTDPENTDLLDLACWWVAIDADGEPLLLAVVAVDGPWALLRYFRTLQQNLLAMDARFLMTEVMVNELGAVGVLHLATDMSPVRLSRGLRDFQRHTGFVLRRVRVRG